jgi:hypothetical protein
MGWDFGETERMDKFTYWLDKYEEVSKKLEWYRGFANQYQEALDEAQAQLEATERQRRYLLGALLSRNPDAKVEP